jgi:RNA polymerase sigma-70 factor (ECF subfamily)
MGVYFFNVVVKILNLLPVVETNDLLLFDLVKTANKQAFEKLFRKYYESVSRFVYRYVKDADSAEEITQDLFIHFWENAPAMQIRISLKAYLFTSARNFALNYIRRNKIRKKYHEEVQSIDLLEEMSIESDQASAFTVLMNQALTALPEKCRVIFELSKYEGLSYDEIAEYLSISKKTVENQITIALHKLREWLRPHMDLIYNDRNG